MKNWLIAAAVAGSAVYGYQQHAQGRRAPTASVESYPVQSSIDGPPFGFKTATLTPRSRYHIVAKLLSKEHYGSGDQGDLAPWDFALGWGPMSHERVIEQLGITQSNRFYHYHWSDQPPIEVGEIVRNSANMHLIPANPAIEAQLSRARAGYKVVLDGTLVDAAWPNGYRWSTSLTREDTGNGACELMFVEAVTVSLP